MSVPDPGKVDPSLRPPPTEDIASYERHGMWLGVGLLCAAGVVYVLAFVIGIATSPEMIIVFIGLSVLLGLAGGIVLLVKVLNDRARNREDDYYSKNVDH